MVDIIDDIRQEFKDEFFANVETMVSIRGRGPTLNDKLKQIGARRKCRIIEAPTRDGNAFNAPAYSVLVVDTTDGIDSLPLKLTGNKFLIQQLLREARLFNMYKTPDEYIIKDKKLRKLRGRALIVEAKENPKPKPGAKVDYFIDIIMNPDEDLLEGEISIEDSLREGAEIPHEATLQDYGIVTP